MGMIIYWLLVGVAIYAFWKKRQNKKVAAEAEVRDVMSDVSQTKKQMSQEPAAASAEKTKVKPWVYWAVGLGGLMLFGLFSGGGADPCDCVDTFGSYSLDMPSKSKASLSACERKYGLVNGSGPSKAMEACGNKFQ